MKPDLPGVCFVTSREATGDRPLLDVVTEAIAGGCDLVQVHEKDLLGGPMLQLVRSIVEAAKPRADYLFFGPVFATPSKAAFGPPQGPEMLRKVAEAVKIPVWAIGGINPGTAAELRGLPIAGVAAISFIATAADPGAAIGTLRAAVAESGTG
jgi:thiamine monophosphate synthase